MTSKGFRNAAFLDTPVFVKDPAFGGKGDGATNDAEAIADSVSGGRLVSVTRGTYLAQANASTILTTDGSTVIEGEGDKSVIKLQETSASGTSEWFTMGVAGLVIKNLKLLFDKTQVGVSTELLTLTRYDNVRLENVAIDGQTSLVGGTQDRSVQIIKAHNTAGVDTVEMMNCDVTGIARAYTRDNADTAAHKILKFVCNKFRNIWRTALTVNAPNGSIEDVLVLGNTFDTHAGVVNADSSLADNNNAVGLQGVLGGRVIGNHVSGSYGAVVHIEENTDGVSVIGNTARMANEGATDAAFETSANNISGTVVIPTHGAVIGNVLRSTDGVGTGFQIQSAASADGIRWAVFSGNVSSGFADAFKTSTDTRSVLISDNILRGTTNALDLTRASLLVRGNVVEDCTVPVACSRGGLVGAVHYVDLSSATAALTAFGSSSNGPLTLTEWTWETNLFSTANGSQYIDIGPTPTRIYGFFTIAITQSGSVHRLTVFECSYDGATFTNTSKLSYGSGTITITGPADNSGTFAIQISDSAGSGSANVRMQVRFHGGAFVI